MRFLELMFMGLFGVGELVGAQLVPDRGQSPIISDPTRSINRVPFSTRAHWMRRANTLLAELGSPCTFAAFGTVIVNHTDPNSELGELVCTGVNSNAATGNPTLHGEIAAINNCTAVLTDPNGKYKLSPAQTLVEFSHLSLYTNAEACSMCSSAIRRSGFREYIYGTSIETLIREGWGQIRISSLEVFRESFDLAGASRLIGGVLSNETDSSFKWQYNPSYPCPNGCTRVAGVCQSG